MYHDKLQHIHLWSEVYILRHKYHYRLSFTSLMNCSFSGEELFCCTHTVHFEQGKHKCLVHKVELYWFPFK